MITLQHSASRTLKQSTSAENDIDFVLVDRNRIDVAGSPTSTVEQDANVMRTTSSFWPEYDIIAPADTVFESLDNAVATVDSAGTVTHIADGQTQIKLSSRLMQRVVQKDVSYVASGVDDTFVSWINGSLAKHMDDNINTRIAVETDKIIHDGSAYQTSWVSDIDLTCVSRETPRCTAITPRHVVMAKHFQTKTKISFLQADGTIVDRIILRRMNASPFLGSGTDTVLGLLDEDLPSQITPAKIPEDISPYLPTSTDYVVPCLSLDRENKANISSLVVAADRLAYFRTPTDATQAGFAETLVGGDSGNPVFILVTVGPETIPALICTWWHTYGLPGSGDGPNISQMQTLINSTISAIDSAEGINTGYTITTLDLSNFGLA